MNVIFWFLSVGLNPTEAAKLNNYLHFSDPKNLRKKSVLELADLNPSIDFLDPLSDDIPGGETCKQEMQHVHAVSQNIMTTRRSGE